MLVYVLHFRATDDKMSFCYQHGRYNFFLKRMKIFFFKVLTLHLWTDNLVPNLWQKNWRSHDHVVSSYSLPKFVTTALETLNLLHFIVAWGLPVHGRNCFFFKVLILHLWIANLVTNLWQKIWRSHDHVVSSYSLPEIRYDGAWDIESVAFYTGLAPSSSWKKLFFSRFPSYIYELTTLYPIFDKKLKISWSRRLEL